MNWKFWQRESEADLSLAEINARLRGFILDSQINNAHEISVILGASISSEEVLDKEEEESDKRVSKISYLVPILFAHSHVLAEGATEFQKSSVKQLDVEVQPAQAIPDEIWHESRKLMEQVAVAALMGGISQLVDMGLLEIPKKKRSKHGL